MFDTVEMRAGALTVDRRAHLELVRHSVTTAATLAHERTLPVVDGLAGLVPSGRLQRGNTLAVYGVGATSLALSLVSAAVRDGSFLAIVAPPSFGLGACVDFDIPLRRVVQFVLPVKEAGSSGTSGTRAEGGWAQAVAAVIEGFDLVILADRHRIAAGQARQLAARNRERGSVMVRVGGRPWPDAADLRFDIAAPQWSGLGQGYGHLQGRRVEVRVAGRRYHGHQGPQPILLPAPGGGVEAAPADTPSPLSGAGVEVVVSAAGRFVGSDAAQSEGPTENAVPVAVTDSTTGRYAVTDSTTGRYAGADIDEMIAAADRISGVHDDEVPAVGRGGASSGASA